MIATHALAGDIGEQAVDALTGHGIGAALHTTNNTAAGPALAAGSVVVLVLPPALTFETAYHVEAAWTALVIAGPEHDPGKAWQTLDAALDALAGPLDVDTARPVSFADPQGPLWPAFEITFTTEHIHD